VPLRDELEVVAVAEPAAEMRELIKRLEVEMGDLLWGLALMVSRELRAQNRQAGMTVNPYEDAVQHHTEAERLADAILAELHRGGNTRATRPAEIGRDEATDTEAE
jgi:hypothetical protein